MTHEARAARARADAASPPAVVSALGGLRLHARGEAAGKDARSSDRWALVAAGFRAAAAEASGTYDPLAHPLAATLAAALFDESSGGSLDRFHAIVAAKAAGGAPSSGGQAAAAAKAVAMGRLRCPAARAAFHDAFETFVAGVALPSLAETWDRAAQTSVGDTVSSSATAVEFDSEAAAAASPVGAWLSECWVQSFPCVRVLTPGDFSLPPHCDSA